MTSANLTLIYLSFIGLLAGGVCCRYYSNDSWVERYEPIIYCLFSSALIGFTAFRPFGAGLDDGVHYVLHYRDLCPLTHCQNWSIKGRDYVWYLTIAALKTIWQSPTVILWVSAACLLVKLVIIRHLCQHLLLALLIYVSVFYQTHDMTTFRQSMALMFYLLAFWMLARCRILATLPFLILSGLTHKQGILSVFLFATPLVSRYRTMVPSLIITCIVMILCGFYPYHSIGILSKWIVIPFWVSNILFSYVRPVDSGWFGLYFRSIPLEIYPLTFGIFYSIKGDGALNGRVRRASVVSVLLAYIFLWLLAGYEVVQYRLFYFFLLPLVFVVGGGALRQFTVPIILLISTVFVVKYDVVHSFFLDAARINFKIEGEGVIDDSKSVWVPCGTDCRNYGRGARVLFVAMPTNGHFRGWGGLCLGLGAQCPLVLDGDGLVSVRFARVTVLTVMKSGEGTVTALGGLKCGADCEQRVDGGQLLFDRGPKTVLEAKPAPGYRFAGWSGACVGDQPTCDLTLDEDRSVEAVFEPISENDAANPR